MSYTNLTMLRALTNSKRLKNIGMIFCCKVRHKTCTTSVDYKKNLIFALKTVFQQKKIYFITKIILKNISKNFVK